MKNRKVIMEKNANAFGKKSEDVYISHAPGKAENIGYMKSMPKKKKGKKRPKTMIRQNEMLKEANALTSAIMKDPVLCEKAQKEFDAKYAKRGILYMKNGKWVRRRLVDYVREREMKKLVKRPAGKSGK